MKKNIILLFLTLLLLAVSRLSAQNATDKTQTYDAKELLSIIAVKQKEIVVKYNDWSSDKMFELRKLYLQYFQMEESLQFNKNTFLDGILSKEIDYISSDDGTIRVFSWVADCRSRVYEHDSIVQFRDSAGKLRTASVTQIIANYNLDIAHGDLLYTSVFVEIYRLKEGVYLLSGFTGVDHRYFMEDFLTLELKANEVIPYYAFKNNNIIISVGRSVGTNLNDLPDTLNTKIISQPDLFAIELDMLFPKNPENMYKWVNYNDYIVKEKDTFKHKERFVFNGTEFVGNYWVLEEYWEKGERPEDISQFFQKIEFDENIEQQEFDEQDSTVSVEAEDADNIEKEKSAKTRMGFKIILILIASIAVVVSGVVFVVKRKK